jgi:hypothetical protein
VVSRTDEFVQRFRFDSFSNGELVGDIEQSGTTDGHVSSRNGTFSWQT